ncbi:haloacid dehalogenase type II [Fusarium beomiforme]|uniref:Haloacid dehalogenase type II n=1 Tax=Fusarium beomiforme TaxID=44412 RepID=A0A9P5A4Y6_9HYPO|nr:haloacid dehalogenase type II [Fusarium beomiforme]
MERTVIAFDLYGTILSTGSISGELAKLYGEDKAQSIAALARRYQLESTWRVTSMGAYRTFSDLTRWSFRQAAKETGVELTSEQEKRIMDAYNGLDTFPDVDKALKSLSDHASIDPYIFSNGTKVMMTSSLDTSPTLSQVSNIFPNEKVVSIDPLKVFKPHPRTYEFMAETAGMKSQLDKIWLVSSNPFDVTGATAFGFKSAWIDREDKGWTDTLGCSLGLEPTVVASGVDEAVRVILRQSEGDK